MRTGNWKGNTLWYNVLGPAEWELVSLDAALPAGRSGESEHGVITNVSLLESGSYAPQASDQNS